MDIDWTSVATGAAIFAGVGYAAATATAPPAAKQVDMYSYIVPDSEDVPNGLGAIFRHPDAKEKLTDTLGKGEKTAYEGFQTGVKVAGSSPCLGARRQIGVDDKGKPICAEFVWESYDEVNARINNFASGLEHLELIPLIKGEPSMRMVALFMKNRPEWVIAEQACFRQSATTVPMYDTLGPDVVDMIINETELQTVVCSPKEIQALLDVKDKCPSLANIIHTDEAPADLQDKAKACGLSIHSFSEIESIGKANPSDPRPPSPTDVATFCYTSGTTGKSKGALLTHRNMVAQSAAVKGVGMVLGAGDRHLSYLPLPHVFERAVQGVCFNSGACVGFFQGETTKIPDDLATLRPTLFPSVPRLLNRFYDKVFAGAQASGGLKTKLFNMAYAAKQEGLKQGYNKHRLWDKLVFGKVAKKLGLDECKYVITGSAPIAPHVIEFLRILLSCSVSEGYGQTETTAGATIQALDDYSTGNVGYPINCNEVRLVSVPDMGYNVADRIHGADEDRGVAGVPCLGRGEICFRGPNCFLGYYKMPDKTAEAIDSEGWVHSGDIGIWTPKGQLRIVDRKKNIFKLAQGEYIAPEKVENVYMKSSIVLQAFVYGDSFQHQLVAIIVPDPEAVPAFVASNGLTDMPLADLCQSEEFKKAVHADLDRLRKEAKLFGFEHAAKLHLDPEPFSVENDILTPTFKLKRDIAKKHYQKDIDAMYDALGGVAGVKGLKQSH